MKYGNELKVGLAIVAAVVIFIFGFRFFRDLPLFRGSYNLNTRLAKSGGLVAGNAVRISGVKVGSVERVALTEDQDAVNVRFRVNEGTTIPQGSHAEATGISALGGISLAITPGPPGNPRVAPGGTVPGRTAPSVVNKLTERAPMIVDRADSLLMTANATLGEAGALFSSPDSDLRQTLAAIRQSTETLNRVLAAQEGRLASVLENAEASSADLRAFTSSNTDSLSLAVSRLNAALGSLNNNLAGLETTTARLDSISARINSGEGTLGRLINDPGLYVRLDSTATRMDAVLEDFQANPERYLEDLTLVDIF